MLEKDKTNPPTHHRPLKIKELNGEYQGLQGFFKQNKKKYRILSWCLKIDLDVNPLSN